MAGSQLKRMKKQLFEHRWAIIMAKTAFLQRFGRTRSLSFSSSFLLWKFSAIYRSFILYSRYAHIRLIYGLTKSIFERFNLTVFFIFRRKHSNSLSNDYLYVKKIYRGRNTYANCAQVKVQGLSIRPLFSLWVEKVSTYTSFFPSTFSSFYTV